MLDEDKVKWLIEDVVDKIFDCFMPSHYVGDVKRQVYEVIRKADLTKDEDETSN